MPVERVKEVLITVKLTSAKTISAIIAMVMPVRYREAAG